MFNNSNNVSQSDPENKGPNSIEQENRILPKARTRPSQTALDACCSGVSRTDAREQWLTGKEYPIHPLLTNDSSLFLLLESIIVGCWFHIFSLSNPNLTFLRPGLEKQNPTTAKEPTTVAKA